MTIIEALTAAIQVPGIDTSTLEKACIDAALTTNATYAKSNELAVDQAAVNVLRSLVISSEKEGGYSYGVSADALKTRISYLETKLGIDNSTSPQINAVSKW